MEMLQLKDNFMDCSEPFNWSPHTTLLIDKPEVIQKAIPVVLDTFSAFEGKVVTLHLFEFWVKAKQNTMPILGLVKQPIVVNVKHEDLDSDDF